MTENLDDNMLVHTASATAVAAGGPIGVIAEGILGAPGRQLNRILQANFEDFVWGSFGDVNKSLGDIQDEQERLRRLVEWLEDEVTALGDRLGQIEESVMAKVLLDSVKAVCDVWAEMADPEMYGYLRAALRSLAIRRDLFRGSVAPRLLDCLSKLESDQVEMLGVIWREEREGGLTRETFESGFGPYRHENLNRLVSLELLAERAVKLVQMKNGRAESKWVTPLGRDFLRFVEMIDDDGDDISAEALWRDRRGRRGRASILPEPLQPDQDPRHAIRQAEKKWGTP
jgi:hypothetical protein